MDAEPLQEVVRALGPGILKSAAQFGAMTGAAGATAGGIVGLAKDVTPTLFFIGSGVQCFALGSTFYATRHSALVYLARRKGIVHSDLTPEQKIQASCVGGGVSGFTTAAIFRGRANLLPGSIVFTLFGYLGQRYVNNREAALLPSTYEDRPNLWHRMLSSKWSPVKAFPDDEYENMLQEQLNQINVELALIDEDIVKIKAGQSRISLE
ncbi:MAG: hypothetical protein M1828_005504 [Chrysothrix sp. TS-e1954]|nr:MAG: hypothetical protein M1828_005504 [Chrysothrix sp. TS-e1954]